MNSLDVLEGGADAEELLWDLERRAGDLAHYADRVVLAVRDNDPFLKDDIEALERAIAKVKEVLP